MVKEPTEQRLEQRALRILEEALELDGDALARHLEAACGDDERLRARVRALLDVARARGELTALGETPGAADLLGAAAGEAPTGARFGGFEVVRLLGRGGVGVVYEALQAHPRRRVALKTLRVPSDEARRRFAAEAELLARLKHPGIAQVFDAGLSEGHGPLGSEEVPWIALEYVEGARTVRAFVEEEGLDARAVAALLARVADAVHHGHQRGIVHRDLKPANVLVDAEGTPKVIDFGVARVLHGGGEGDGGTRTGDLVGTPDYMAPEQLAGDPLDVDTRADVWALGVLAYELLAGRRPFELARLGWSERVRTLERTSAPGLRELRPDCPRDLEAIVRRCLEPHRDARYPSAAALAEDLRRFLAGRPVDARPPTLGYVLRRFVARNRALVGAGAAVALLLAATTWISVASAREARAAEAAERQERLEKAALAGEMQALAVDVLLGSVQQLAALSGSVDVRLELTEQAVAQLDRLARRSPAEPTVREDLARAYVKLADLQGNMRSANVGDVPGALASLGKADVLLADLAAEGHDSEVARALRVSALTRRGDLARGNRETEVGLEAFGRLEALHAEAVAQDPTDEEAWKGLTDAVNSRARLMSFERRYADAAAEMDRALALVEDAAERFPGADWVVWQHTSYLGTRGGIARLQGRPEEALAWMLRAQAEDRELLALRPDDAEIELNVAQTGYNLAETYTELGREEEALQVAGDSLRTLERLARAGPSDARLDVSLAAMHYQRGLALLGLARDADAAEDVEGRQALALEALEALATSRRFAEGAGGGAGPLVEGLLEDLSEAEGEATRLAE